MATCPKCKNTSGNDWSQCGGRCPMPMSPHYEKKVCKHQHYSQDKVTGECHCDQCGKLLIDSIGRVLE